jgi:ribonuclease E
MDPEPAGLTHDGREAEAAAVEVATQDEPDAATPAHAEEAAVAEADATQDAGPDGLAPVGRPRRRRAASRPAGPPV